MKIKKLQILVFVFLLAISAGCVSIRPPSRVAPITVTLETTGYCACGKCCGWERNWLGRPIISQGNMRGKPKHVGITASGTKARKGTIAADTSRYPFGTIMYIKGYGYGVVEDRGSAIKGDKIDLFFRRHSDAIRWGRRRLPVKIWIK